MHTLLKIQDKITTFLVVGGDGAAWYSFPLDTNIFFETKYIKKLTMPLNSRLIKATFSKKKYPLICYEKLAKFIFLN